MTEKVKLLLEDLKSKEYKKLRSVIKKDNYFNYGTANDIFSNFLKHENPILFENDDFGFNRSFTQKAEFKRMGNVTPNYFKILTTGFNNLIDEIRKSVDSCEDKIKKRFGKDMIFQLEECIRFSAIYRDFAKESGNIKLYNALLNIPCKPAESFYEACVFLKLCIFFLRLTSVDHLGLGRFDQYMYQFYLKDKEKGITDEEILETIEEFFISINRDSDLYNGVQQGDNGQSMVLGGCDENGNDKYNELSKMCLQASLELNLIDPKINLRVNKNTPDELYEFATLLTKQGLGFPQYCNDDVVIPGLIKLGYDKKDAADYVVAACWEYIIPCCGADIPNIETMDFPKIINDTIVSKLKKCNFFDELIEDVKLAIVKECDRLVAKRPAPTDYYEFKKALLSSFMDGCIENLTDLFRHGTKYMNYGCHGAGIANAADALAAVKKCVFEEKTINKNDLLDALNKDFIGYDEIRNTLRNCPKMGNNDDYVDDIAILLMETFSKNLNNRDNCIGGIWRAGTGSAMEYIWKGRECPATADGRKAYTPYSSSFSPALDVKTDGVLSVIQSFTKNDMTNIINGGPLTIEIHDTVFKNDIGIKKVAQLVKSFVQLGGHQLQLNSISREKLIDAQKHPENYTNLIVRVWGWSGYFNELDVEFQNHIIKRTEYSV